MKNRLIAFLCAVTIAYGSNAFANEEELFVSNLDISSHEAKQIADKENQNLLQRLNLLQTNTGTNVDVNDFLPKSDHELIAPAIHFQEFSEKPSSKGEIKESLETFRQKEHLEGDELFFSMANQVTNQPIKTIGVESIEVDNIPDQKQLQICRESGNYQQVIYQMRIVDIIPEKKEHVLHCLGHYTHEDFLWEKNAKKRSCQIREELRKDKKILSVSTELNYQGMFKGYRVGITWYHKNGIPCLKHESREAIVSPAKEVDRWVTNEQIALKELEDNTNCQLLYSQITKGAETRVIQERRVYRDAWGRALFFSCGNTLQQSPCSRLREQGGVIISKRCLRTTSFGECDEWEKTYDLGGIAAHQKTKINFEQDAIWGLDEQSQVVYERNMEFGDVVSSLLVVSDISENLTPEFADESSTSIFNGTPKRCKRSLMNNVLYDCCKKMKGLALKAQLAQCDQEEWDLAENREMGKCHYIGVRERKMGFEKQHVYCCFPTKLSRVIHEEGRKQLQIEWGDAESPICRGFNLSELQQLNFSIMDFSEVIEELGEKIDQQSLAKRLHSSVQSISSEGGVQNIQKRTEQISNTEGYLK